MSLFRRAWRTFSGWPRWAQILTGIVIVVVIAVATRNSGNKNQPLVGPIDSSLGTPGAGCCGQPPSGGSRRVTKAEFGSAWPLTVSEGTLSCHQPPYIGAVIFTTDDGTVYWLNGTAGDSASKYGWKNVKPIWAKPKHPSFSGERKDIGVLIDAGLKLCGS